MTHRIDIPDAKPRPIGYTAADIVIATLRDCGMDPRRAHDNPMAVQLIRVWLRGEWTEAQFRHAIRNLLILNPGLKL